MEFWGVVKTDDTFENVPEVIGFFATRKDAEKEAANRRKVDAWYNYNVHPMTMENG